MGYKDIVIPEGKSPLEYTAFQRRGEIFGMILKAGHPDMLSRTELARRYGKTQGLISQDIAKIRESIKKELGTDAQFITHVVFQKTIKELMGGDKKDKFNAAKLLKDWNDWLFELGAQKRVPKELNIESTNKTELTLAEAYKKSLEKEK